VFIFPFLFFSLEECIHIILFSFSESLCQENIRGLPVGDGAHLVLDANGTFGVEEVTRAFLSSPGIEPALVPAGWVGNHYRWLVWKFASVERSFPQQFAARCENSSVTIKYYTILLYS
jgi:hypothetical protein